MSFASSGYKDIEKYRASVRRYKNGSSGKTARRRYRSGEVGKAAHRRDFQNYARNNPAKIRAHQLVAQAISKGLMSRKSCVICGFEITHAHHVNYDKPYDVTWLCHAHHMDEHNKERRDN